MVFLNKRLDKDFILPFTELIAREKLKEILKTIKKPKNIKKPRSKYSIKQQKK